MTIRSNIEDLIKIRAIIEQGREGPEHFLRARVNTAAARLDTLLDTYPETGERVLYKGVFGSIATVRGIDEGWIALTFNDLSQVTARPSSVLRFNRQTFVTAMNAYEDAIMKNDHLGMERWANISNEIEAHLGADSLRLRGLHKVAAEVLVA